MKHKRRGWERFLSEEEFRRLGKALAEAENGKGISAHTLATIRLLLLTGYRKIEILTLENPCDIPVIHPKSTLNRAIHTQFIHGHAVIYQSSVCVHRQ